MAQCFSGGFNRAVSQASQAASTFIASAADEMSPSFTLPDDLNWDSFQRNFIAALGGYDVNGLPHPRTHHSGAQRWVTVGEAFECAVTAPIRSPYDSPEYAARPEHAVNMTLGEETSNSVRCDDSSEPTVVIGDLQPSPEEGIRILRATGL
jgi:hypothetical protein